MFKPLRTAAALPTQDLGRAKAIYRDKLGLTPALEGARELMYVLAAGTGFGVPPSLAATARDPSIPLATTAVVTAPALSSSRRESPCLCAWDVV